MRSSRTFLQIQMVSVVFCIIIGMSETYAALAWAKDLIPLILPLLIVNLAAPWTILFYAVWEKRPPAVIFGATTLSVVLTLGAFFAMMPLIS
jgi:hypothetical protein